MTVPSQDHLQAGLAFFTMLEPGGADRECSQEQKSMLEKNVLPKKILGATREQLKAVGFKFGRAVDDLFQKCELPEGWTIEASSHVMHNYVKDQRGRTRARIFYKASFYDREADMTMEQRFSVRLHLKSSDPNVNRCAVFDDETEIFSPGQYTIRDWAEQDKLQFQAQVWLEERHPQHRDPMAYWD